MFLDVHIVLVRTGIMFVLLPDVHLVRVFVLNPAPDGKIAEICINVSVLAACIIHPLSLFDKLSVCMICFSCSIRAELRNIPVLPLRPQSCRLAESLVFLVETTIPYSLGRILLIVSASFSGYQLTFNFTHGRFNLSLLLRCLVKGVLLALKLKRRRVDVL